MKKNNKKSTGSKVTMKSVKRSVKKAVQSVRKAAKKVVGTKTSRQRLSTNVAKGALLVTVGPVMAVEWGAKALWEKAFG